MLRTRVGYSGGTTPSPTYHSIGDHAEAFEVDFDPSVISFEELARFFFQSHNPCRTAWSTQYRSAAFPRTPQQRKILEAVAAKAADSAGGELETAIEDFTGFTLAEDYHQKYRLRSVTAALAEYEDMFPDMESLLASVAVTKANAFIGGYGTTRALRDDVDKLGLTDDTTDLIRRVAR